MAYAATGTAGNDTLNQGTDTGPGTIVGLAGDDCIFTGTGLATVTGDSGNDTVLLQTGNTGTVNGGTENDCIQNQGFNIGSMVIFGGDGVDQINTVGSTSPQTVVGGNDSSDGNDVIITGSGADLAFGNGGNDQMSTGTGNDTEIGGFGNDLFIDNGGANLVFGNEGSDQYQATAGGADTFFGGLGNDSYQAGAGGSPLVFGNEGNDTVDATTNTGGLTVVGGNDSADGSDSIFTGAGADLLFGNGGNDTLSIGAGNDTAVAGFGNDSVTNSGGASNNLMFGNEGNDTLEAFAAAGQNTVFGGLGNDSVRMSQDGNLATNRDSVQGNEGNDSLQGSDAVDTISGGSGNDVFVYEFAGHDGNNAAGGGPVEFLTDVNWAEDKVDTAVQVTFAANMGAGTGTDLNSSANNAIAAAFALNGGAGVVAAQFTFAGRTYLAINQDGAMNAFLDTGDLLLDITGVTGTIGGSNFI